MEKLFHEWIKNDRNIFFSNIAQSLGELKEIIFKNNGKLILTRSQTISKSLGAALLSTDLSISKKIDAVKKGEAAYLLWRGAVQVSLTEPTPYRGMQNMHEVNTPLRSYNIDLAVTALAALCGKHNISIQSNIDPVDTNGMSPPLDFHFDRGAELTILAALRGDPKKFNFLISFQSLIDQINNQNIGRLLAQPYYSASASMLPFSILNLKKLQGVYTLNKAIITNCLELDDIKPFGKMTEHAKAYSSFLEALTHANCKFLRKNCENKEIEQFKKSHFIESICLGSGDILLINNSIVLHGRASGMCSDLVNNRWLRVSFL